MFHVHCSPRSCIVYHFDVLTKVFTSSGLARTLGRSAFARPQATRRAFEPLRKNALPAIAARFASSDSAKNGKIHQVIGAVVDGTDIPCRVVMELQEKPSSYARAQIHESRS